MSGCRVVMAMLIQILLLAAIQADAVAHSRTIEEVRTDSSIGLEYVKKVAVYQKTYFDRVDTLRSMSSGENGTLNCQAAIAYSLVAYMNELVSMAAINSRMYLMASVLAWKQGEEMYGIGGLVLSMYQFEKEVYGYVDMMSKRYINDERLMRIVREDEKMVKELLDSWPFRGSEYSEKKGEPLARMKNEYDEFGKTSIETMNYYRSIADYFDPSKGNYSIENGVCGDALLVYAEMKGLAVRIVNVMAMVQLWGLSEHYGMYPEVKSQEKYAMAWLELFYPGIENWSKGFEELGAHSADPAVRQAAQEYAQHYVPWRKSLDAALAADGLSMPGQQQAQQATQ